jgi:hypothetical protein
MSIFVLRDNVIKERSNVDCVIYYAWNRGYTQ